MAEPDVAQVANFALQVALTELLAGASGSSPKRSSATAHGEMAAAYAAGALTLDEAGAPLHLPRSRLQQTLCGRGAMMAVACGEHDLALPPGISVAAVNSRRSVTLTGDVDAIAIGSLRLVNVLLRLARGARPARAAGTRRSTAEAWQSHLGSSSPGRRW